jgi:hypothetical protein
MSKEILKKECQKIINNLPLNENIKEKYPDEYLFFQNLFKNHPDYPYKFENMKDIQVVLNKQYYNKELQIIKFNNIIDTVSYNKCITGKKDNEKLLLNQSLRYSIYEQIKEFKENNDISKCIFCESSNNIEIDHINTFASLVKSFLNETKYEIPKIFERTNGNSYKFMKNDILFQKEWELYHKKNAKLRPLCKQCNLKRR